MDRPFAMAYIWNLGIPTSDYQEPLFGKPYTDKSLLGSILRPLVDGKSLA